MPCTSPLQGFFSGVNGKFKYSEAAQEAFKAGKPLKGASAVSCGQCMDCRLRRSRDWAIRATHEASLWESNCFLTFTFSNEAMFEHCPKVLWLDPFSDFTPDSSVTVYENFSLVKRHMVKFNMDLRERLYPHRVRFMYCGEYGTKYKRPHYHSICFNYDFPDRKFYKSIGTKRYYNSDLLSSLWPHGHAVISDFSFETAAYVGGYIMDKVGGRGANAHYRGKLPEFAGFSRRPGLGHDWFMKYWPDVYPADEVVIQLGKRKARLRPPRYYDKLMENLDPVIYETVCEKRKSKMEEVEDDNTYERLLVKNKCTKARLGRLVKNLENS